MLVTTAPAAGCLIRRSDMDVLFFIGGVFILVFAVTAACFALARFAGGRAGARTIDCAPEDSEPSANG